MAKRSSAEVFEAAVLDLVSENAALRCRAQRRLVEKVAEFSVIVIATEGFHRQGREEIQSNGGVPAGGDSVRATDARSAGRESHA